MAQQIITKSGMTFEQIRSQASGLHFAKNMLTDAEREMLALLEGALDLLDDLTPNNNFRGYAEELTGYEPRKTNILPE